MGEETKFSDCRIQEIRFPVETQEAGVEPVITVVIEMPATKRARLKPLLSFQMKKKAVTVTFDASS